MTAQEFFDRRHPELSNGPGTELKTILSGFGITERYGCGCASLAASMNRLGVDGCKAITDELAEHLESAARERGWKLPGLRFGAKALVRLALMKSCWRHQDVHPATPPIV